MNDYFHESVPDGISNGIHAFDSNIDCSNQDSYELFVEVFGSNVCGDDLKNASDEELGRFAQVMQTYFELTYLPSTDDAKRIIRQALEQWGN